VKGDELVALEFRSKMEGCKVQSLPSVLRLWRAGEIDGKSKPPHVQVDCTVSRATLDTPQEKLPVLLQRRKEKKVDAFCSVDLGAG
jgi:hypothetical protein